MKCEIDCGIDVRTIAWKVENICVNKYKYILSSKACLHVIQNINIGKNIDNVRFGLWWSHAEALS